MTGDVAMRTREQLELEALAREFAAGEIRPHAAAWDEARELPDEIFRKLGEMGFLGMRVPEAHGGLGLDLPTALLVLEALAWGDASVGLAVAIHTGPVTRLLLERGSEAQRERWLPRLASGEALGALALSEEGAGSDASALEARAERAGEGWRLRGTKRWVTNGGRAGLLVVFARTGEGKEGISAFLVEGGRQGIRVAHRERTLGLAASETVTLDLDLELSGESLLGREGDGWAAALDALTAGRLTVAAQALGIARAAQEHALRYALEREQFGAPLASFGAIREKLASMSIGILQARALLLETAERAERGIDGGSAVPSSIAAHAAAAKVAASEAAMWISDEAVQIFGGYGYMKHYPVEKLMRDAKGTEIYEGANEVLRWLIARDAIREAGQG